MREDWWLQGVAITTLAVALAIVGAYLTIGYNLARSAVSLNTGANLRVVLAGDLNAQDLARALAGIRGLAGVVRAEYVSPKEGMARFREQLGANSPLLEGVEENPLPPLIEVRLSPGPGVEDRVMPSINALSGVTGVVTGRPWLASLDRALAVFSRVGAALGGLLFLAVVLLVANTVRLAVYIRQEQLEVMALVGATAGYMRWPFIWEAVLQTLIAASLASAAIWALFSLLGSPVTLPLGLNLEDLMRMSWRIPAALGLLGALAGVIGGFMGVARVLEREGVL